MTTSAFHTHLEEGVVVLGSVRLVLRGRRQTFVLRYRDFDVLHVDRISIYVCVEIERAIDQYCSVVLSVTVRLLSRAMVFVPGSSSWAIANVVWRDERRSLVPGFVGRSLARVLNLQYSQQESGQRRPTTW